VSGLAWLRGGLGRVLAALLPSWFAWAGSVAVLGWLAFAATRAPGAVGLIFAVRLAPLVVVGLPVGTLADRFGRVRLLQASNLFAALTMFGLAFLATSRTPGLYLLLAVAILLGLADAGRLVCGNNLVFEFAGALGPIRAFAASNFAGAVGQIAGGAIGGLAISAMGPAFAAAIVGAASAAGSLLLFGVEDRHTSLSSEATSFPRAVRDGVALLRRIPAVGLLIAVALVVEMFAFSCPALDPVFAGQVFLVGPTGLGLILAARGLGRMVGSAGLAAMRPRRLLGRTLTVAVIGFGLALAAYAAAPGLLVALPLVLGAGIASVLVDALVLASLQASVEAASRGRAAGLWVLMIGFQPIGVLEVGLVAQLGGARLAQGLNGALVIAFGILLLATALGRRLQGVQTAAVGVSNPLRGEG
jgi:MFS family permease